ncbi:hypothetical protein K505DRAFT_259722 [Melanomma pulvis-pyrius CBS 109.77]|uniref:Ricin B lectin domain-containing protein n=1 Tax=Melanomma pulvis-pyrius CBS 109.77 TaxID=1314802 RepID=A0A6A6WRV3_9PLEO|nr:hypothetical protein K505DRAFT_259722 [Melanomma pulvis-pyrius CBS 109.77]
MANFNSSFWYHLYVNQNEKAGLSGTNLYNNNNTTGAVFFTTFSTDDSAQRWQWYGVTSTTYVLRCKEGGPNAFLSTKFEPKESTPGQTQALMVRGNVSDDSVFWEVSPWGDGTFFLDNSENGTSWHLEKKGNGLLTLSSNITAPRPGQRWSFKAIEPINDAAFSTIDVRITKLIMLS